MDSLHKNITSLKLINTKYLQSGKRKRWEKFEVEAREFQIANSEFSPQKKKLSIRTNSDQIIKNMTCIRITNTRKVRDG